MYKTSTIVNISASILVWSLVKQNIIRSIICHMEDWINGQSVKEITNMSKSEKVVIVSLEMSELLRFLSYFSYFDILNKLSLLHCKHSKYIYGRCLNFPCFINYLTACMHAFCMLCLYV